MGEYQFYEFRALDRALTEDEMELLSATSSRAQISPMQYVNVYNFGDFRGDPDEWMAKYFDAFVYVASWGQRKLKFRFPKNVLPYAEIKPYCTEHAISAKQSGGNVVLSFDYNDDSLEREYWGEGDGWLKALIPLRRELAAGDRRALYLGWLLGIQQNDVEEDEPEPPVPPMLKKTSPVLKKFLKFIALDSNLLAVAAERSSASDATAGNNLSDRSPRRTAGELLLSAERRARE